jgi:Family of unknown function (DUF6402)
MAVTVTNIPSTMRRENLPKAAELMETWFSRQGAIAPAYSDAVTDVITMKWALKFQRALTVYEALIWDRIWENAAAQKEIAKMLRRNGFMKDRREVCEAFGDFTQPVSVLDKDYINQRPIAAYETDFFMPVVDDMAAALGRFNFRVVVAGTVMPAKAGYEVTVEEIGVYIADSYDFEGEQFLGYWDMGTSSGTPGVKLTESVHNSDFRDWRAKTGRGGDFLVYSDLYRTVLSRSFTFLVA